MLTFLRKIKWIYVQIVLLVIMTILLVIFVCIKSNPDIAEAWTQGFGRTYAKVLTPLTSWIPFSFTELSIAALVVLIILFLVKIIMHLVKKQFLDAAKKALVIANSLVAVFLVYTMSCEFAYARKKVDLPFYEQEIDASEFKDIYNYYADDLNYCISQMKFLSNGDIDSSLSIKEISRLVEESYSIITSDYYFDTNAHAKPMVTSFIYRELQLTGVTFGPYAEPNVNYLATKMELPFVVAHELAHTKGVMREDDANQVAFYVCLNSKNPYVRFSAYGLYFYQIRAITSSVYIPQEDIDQLHKVDSNYYKATRYAANYWKEHDLMGKIGDWINNLYITSSGVEEGTSSYSGGSTIEPPDPVTLKLKPNLYQKLFFESYMRNKR